MERYLRFPGGKPKALTLSYDDGVIFDKRLIEIMQKYGYQQRTGSLLENEEYRKYLQASYDEANREKKRITGREFMTSGSDMDFELTDDGLDEE